MNARYMSRPALRTAAGWAAIWYVWGALFAAIPALYIFYPDAYITAYISVAWPLGGWPSPVVVGALATIPTTFMYWRLRA